jgi:hypothetical protein
MNMATSNSNRAMSSSSGSTTSTTSTTTTSSTSSDTTVVSSTSPQQQQYQHRQPGTITKKLRVLDDVTVQHIVHDLKSVDRNHDGRYVRTLQSQERCTIRYDKKIGKSRQKST